MRLVDAVDMKKTWYKEHNIEPGESGAMFVGNNEVPMFIDRARTIDAVPVVRCKDCKHCEYASNRIPVEQAWVCYKLGIDVEQDWFCADGERKDNE